MSGSSSTLLNVNLYGLSVLKIKLLLFYQNKLLYIVTLGTICIVTQNVRSSQSRQTCELLKYKSLESLYGSCYMFISIWHEKFIAMKIIIHNYLKRYIWYYQKHLEKCNNIRNSWAVTNFPNFLWILVLPYLSLWFLVSAMSKLQKL